MDRQTALTLIKRHESELRRLGVIGLALFGSTARDEATHSSDVDVVVRLTKGPHGFAYIGRLDTIKMRLSTILGTEVDLIAEPASKPGLQEEINRDRCPVF
jgi:hypothetical protein